MMSTASSTMMSGSCRRYSSICAKSSPNAASASRSAVISTDIRMTRETAATATAKISARSADKSFAQMSSSAVTGSESVRYPSPEKSVFPNRCTASTNTTMNIAMSA